MNKQKQRIDQLVRQGLVPANQLPILGTALAKAKLGTVLTPRERTVLAQYIDKVTDMVFDDDAIYTRARLHTQNTKYQTEEKAVSIDENVKIIDGPEEKEPDQREKDERKAKKIHLSARDKFRKLSPAIKKEKLKAGLAEDVVSMNNSYKEMFEIALEQYGIKNIRDLPEDKKAEFFTVVDEALKGNQHKIDANKNGKVDAHDFALLRAKKKVKKEEVELTFEEMTPAQKAERLKVIAKAADRVHSGAAAKSVKKVAQADMKKKGAQKGMAPTKKDEMDEQVQELRKMIREGNDKIGAYKLLAKILNNKENSGE